MATCAQPAISAPLQVACHDHPSVAGTLYTGSSFGPLINPGSGVAPRSSAGSSSGPLNQAAVSLPAKIWKGSAPQPASPLPLQAASHGHPIATGTLKPGSGTAPHHRQRNSPLINPAGSRPTHCTSTASPQTAGSQPWPHNKAAGTFNLHSTQAKLNSSCLQIEEGR
jgi:hypothetical protein